MFEIGEVMYVFKGLMFSKEFFKGTIGSILEIETIDGEVLGMEVKDYLITVRLEQEGWDILIDTRKEYYHLVSLHDLELLVKAQMNPLRDLLRKISTSGAKI